MKIIAAILTISMLCSMKTLAQKGEDEAVKAAINQFFQGMKQSDSSMIRQVLFSGARLETASKDKSGNTVVRTEAMDKFLALVASPHSDIYDERITFHSILIDDNLAVVWTPYEFYIGDKFSHKGVNAFQMVKTAEGKWMILSIIDTRRK
jgi:hypothetical protein